MLYKLLTWKIVYNIIVKQKINLILYKINLRKSINRINFLENKIWTLELKI